MTAASIPFMVEIDEQGKLCSINQEMCAALGYTTEEVIGVDYISTFVPKSEIGSLRLAFRNLFEEQKSVSVENSILTKDGKPLLVHWNGKVIQSSHSQCPVIFGMGIDITEMRATENSLRKNEEIQRAIFNQTFQFLGLVEKNGDVREINQTALKFVGCTAADVTGKSFWDTPWWHHSEVEQNKVQDAVSQAGKGALVRFETTHLDVDKEIHLVDFSLKPVTDAEGQTVCLVAEGRDITNIRQTKEVLERTQFSIDHSGTAIFWLDSDGKIHYANNAACSSLGYTSKEMLELSVLDIVPTWTLGSWSSDVWPSLKAAGNRTFQSTHKKKNGGTFAVEVTINYCRFRGTELAFAFVRDITAEHRAEQTIRKSERRYQQLLQSLPAGVCVISVDGQIIEVNDLFCQLYGYSPDELRTLTPLDLITPEYHYLFDRFRESIENGEPFHGQTKDVRKDGTEFTAEVHGIAIEMDGKPHLCAIVRDITEQLQAERAKANLEHQLKQAQKMEAIGNLAGGIAHDFNNILGAIVGYGDLAYELSFPGSKLRTYLEKILQASKRAADLAGHILLFSRKSDQLTEPLEMHLVVKEALKLIRASIPTTIQMRQKIDERAGYIVANATQIHQVVMNLCANGAHAMDENGGLLSVSLTPKTLTDADLKKHPEMPPGTCAELIVSDTGHGIEPDILDKIFDPYFTTKAVGEGSGIGLSVVHGIVKNSGGLIELASHPGKGTDVRVCFPRTEVETDETKEFTLPIPRGSERIMIVDDEVDMVEVLDEMLRDLGYATSSFTDSAIARDQLLHQDSKEFDLLISDFTMPRYTGLDLFKQLRKEGNDIPVILCSGYSSKIDAERARSMNVDGFLQKPFGREILASMVRRILDQKRVR